MMSHTPVVTIIGGGWSVRYIDLAHLAGHVIAVNDAATHLLSWDTVVSMDRMWTEHRWPDLATMLTEHPRRRAWLRRSAVQNLQVTGDFPGVEVFECDHTSNLFAPACAAPRRLNGTNSGACALNLAWQMRPGRLYLLGFDMNRGPGGEAYWYPKYDWKGAGTSNGKYQEWAGQFSQAAADFRAIGCQVYNVSMTSAIESFPKMSATEYRRVAAIAGRP